MSTILVPLLTEKSEVLAAHVQDLYDRYGQRKEMGYSGPIPTLPHFFLLRTFLGENDLLVILNTKRCRYQCSFCTLPEKSSRSRIVDGDVIQQFRHVVDEMRHALSIIDRVTLSNEGSILDESTVGAAAIDEIVTAVGRMRRVRRIEIETRLEFASPERLRQLATLAPRATLGILTGFETVDERIRNQVLKKREPLPSFLAGLDRVADAGSSLTAYVLFKPDPTMTDAEACREASSSIRFLADECGKRSVPLTVRLNPMYLAKGSRWARQAEALTSYLPPRLTDVMRVAEAEVAWNVPIYIGMSSEGLAEEGGTYMARDDYSPCLVKYVKLFNDRKIDRFPWDEIGSIAEAAHV